MTPSLNASPSDLEVVTLRPGSVAIRNIEHTGEYQIATVTTRSRTDFHSTASSVFKDQTDIALDMSCKETLACLKALPPPALSSIRSLHLGKQTCTESRENDCYEELGRFISEDLSLQSITLFTPAEDDWVYSSGETCLHANVIEAFSKGNFMEVRYAHSIHYDQQPSPYYCNHDQPPPSPFFFSFIGYFMEESLLQNCQSRLSLIDRRHTYHNPGLGRLSTCCPPHDEYEEFASSIWNAKGYTLEYDKCRVGETGTVLVLRRVAGLRKRPADEACQNVQKRNK